MHAKQTDTNGGKFFYKENTQPVFEPNTQNVEREKESFVKIIAFFFFGFYDSLERKGSKKNAGCAVKHVQMYTSDAVCFRLYYTICNCIQHFLISFIVRIKSLASTFHDDDDDDDDYHYYFLWKNQQTKFLCVLTTQWQLFKSLEKCVGRWQRTM